MAQLREKLWGGPKSIKEDEHGDARILPYGSALYSEMHRKTGMSSGKMKYAESKAPSMVKDDKVEIVSSIVERKVATYAT